MNDIYQISLNRILVKDNGMTEFITGHNLLSASLVYPREGIQSIETVKKLSLKSNEVYSLKRVNFTEKLLFKESIQGDSAIRIQLTAIEKSDKIVGIIKGLVRTGMMTGLSLVTGGVGISIITAVTKGLTQSIFDMAHTSDKISILGSINFPINNDLPEGELILNLTTPETIKLIERKYKNGQDLLITKTIMKGYGIAQIVLDVKRIPSTQTSISQQSKQLQYV